MSGNHLNRVWSGAYTVNEGLCSLVGFSPSDFKQADYFLLDEINNNAQIIELSDLSSDYKDCMKATKDFDNEDLTYVQMILKNKDKAKDFVDKNNKHIHKNKILFIFTSLLIIY